MTWLTPTGAAVQARSRGEFGRPVSPAPWGDLGERPSRVPNPAASTIAFICPLLQLDMPHHTSTPARPRRCFASCSARYTERCWPPVHPKETIRLLNPGAGKRSHSSLQGQRRCARNWCTLCLLSQVLNATTSSWPVMARKLLFPAPDSAGCAHRIRIRLRSPDDIDGHLRWIREAENSHRQRLNRGANALQLL